MLSSWMPLLWLVLALLVLLLLGRWLNSHLQGLILLVTGNAEIVMYLTFLLLLPGILLHELSHWVAATLLGVRARSFKVFPQKKKGRQFNYGSVQIDRTDPVRQSLIGLAPLLVGSSAVLLCASFGLQIALLSAPQSPQELLHYLAAPDAPLWLYLIFCISNTMVPSESDRQTWGPVLLFASLFAAPLILSGLLAQIPAAVAANLGQLLRYLAYALTLTIAVDLLFALVILLFEYVLGLVLGRRVDY